MKNAYYPKRQASNLKPHGTRTLMSKRQEAPDTTFGTSRTLVRAWPGCIGDRGKRQPEPWKEPMTGEPVHSLGGGRLPSSGALQLKQQG